MTWDEANDNSILFNGVLIYFRNQNTIDQFTKVINFPAGYSIWTSAVYDGSSSVWRWLSGDAINTGLFCDNAYPPGNGTDGLPNRIYYDGSRCLKAGRGSDSRYLTLVGGRFHIPL